MPHTWEVSFRHVCELLGIYMQMTFHIQVLYTNEQRPDTIKTQTPPFIL